MKKTTLLLITLIITCFTAISYRASAQNAFSDLIKSAPDDASKLLNAYAEPLFKGFGTGMNSGWNNTAQTKSLLHFDLRISATGALTPISEQAFDVTKIGLSNHLQPADPTKVISPTIAGESNIDGPVMNVTDGNGRALEQFTLPSGKLSIVPSPQVQLTVGLIKNTDITLRGIPKVNFGSNAGSISMIGFGVKHNIIKDIVGGPVGTLVPFDLAIALNYSRLNSNIGLDVKPDNGTQPANNQQSTDFSHQRIEAHFNSFLAQAIISKRLLFFTPFLSVGYNTANANVAMLGNFPVTSGVNNNGQLTYTTFTDPFTIKENTVSGMRADAGFQLNLAIFRLYASYSLAKYKSFSGGIGFGF